jgi:hypothetical protein
VPVGVGLLGLEVESLLDVFDTLGRIGLAGDLFLDLGDLLRQCLGVDSAPRLLLFAQRREVLTDCTALLASLSPIFLAALCSSDIFLVVFFFAS